MPATQDVAEIAGHGMRAVVNGSQCVLGKGFVLQDALLAFLLAVAVRDLVA